MAQYSEKGQGGKYIKKEGNHGRAELGTNSIPLVKCGIEENYWKSTARMGNITTYNTN